MVLITMSTVLRVLFASIVVVSIQPPVSRVRNTSSDMNALQVNIQSINTSKRLLQAVVEQRSIDVVLLQEVWCPKEEVKLHNFLQPILKLRKDNQYGGVGILVQKNAKVVHCKEYESSNLEAVWADVQLGNERILFGSVYINVGALAEINHLDVILERIIPGC